MPLKTTFCFMVIFSRHTIGIGSIKIIKSMIRLQMPFHLKKAIRSTQVPGTVLSQFLANGWHAVKAKMVQAIQ